MTAIIRYILLTATRDLLFLGIGTILVAAYGLAFFLGYTSLVEQDQMMIATLGGSSRFIIILGLIIFMCFHIRHSFETKEIDVLLSRPLSRTTIIISYWLGFSLLSLLLILPLTLVIAIATPVDMVGLAFWGSQLLLETLIMIAFCLLSSFMLNSATASVLLCTGFYFLSRLMGFMVASARFPETLAGWIDTETILQSILQLISLILPRLDLFTQSSWLVYGAELNYTLFIPYIQASFYIPLLLAITIYDFRHKQC